MKKIFYLPLFLMCALIATSFTFYFSDKKPQEKSLKGLKIVYNVLLTKSCENYEVFVMNTDGAGKKNISNWIGADWAYGAYGDKVYFVSDRDTSKRMWFLYEMDAEGNNVRKIADMRLQDSYISFRKNGQEIIVCPYNKEKKWFFILNTKTGKVLDTLDVPLANIGDPCFLPGEERIVFRGTKVKRGVDELFVMNTDGTGLQQITNYPANDTSAAWYEYHAGPPVWEPNRRVISYISKQKSNHSIFTVKQDGSELKQITDDKMHEGWHTWSPDGKIIVFDGSNLKNENYDIYLMNVDTKSVTQLTNDTLTKQGPMFVTNKR